MTNDNIDNLQTGPPTASAARHKPIVSLLLGITIIGAAVAWIMSGPGLIKRPPRPVFITRDVNEQDAQALMTVRVASSTAQAYQAHILLQGTSAASRTVTVRSELAGRIVSLALAKGEHVNEGELIATLADDIHQTRLLEVAAQLKHRTLEHEATTRLHSRGLGAQTKLAESLAQLETARANSKRALKNIEDTKINAPFAGILNDQLVEVGDYVRVGDAIANIVDLSQVIVRASVSQRQRTLVNIGQAVYANFSGTRNSNTAMREGRLHYVSAVADPTTQTYSIEAQFDNETADLLDGQTVVLKIPGAQVSAHLLPDFALTLNDDGELGVKLVNDKQQVNFKAVSVIAQTRAGTWVTGIPERCRIIVLGQDAIASNSTVNPVDIGAMRSQLPGTVR